jgi:hypothetical protein
VIHSRNTLHSTHTGSVILTFSNSLIHCKGASRTELIHRNSGSDSIQVFSNL